MNKISVLFFLEIIDSEVKNAGFHMYDLYCK